MVEQTQSADGTSIPVVRGPFWVDGKTLPVRNAPPMTLGGDADDVLTDFGLRPEEIEDLRANSVI